VKDGNIGMVVEEPNEAEYDIVKDEKITSKNDTVNP
jgi:hypothetical protein